MTNEEKQQAIDECIDYVGLYDALKKICPFTSDSGHVWEFDTIIRNLFAVICGQDIKYITRTFGLRDKVVDMMMDAHEASINNPFYEFSKKQRDERRNKHK